MIGVRTLKKWYTKKLIGHKKYVKEMAGIEARKKESQINQEWYNLRHAIIYIWKILEPFGGIKNAVNKAWKVHIVLQVSCNEWMGEELYWRSTG